MAHSGKTITFATDLVPQEDNIYNLGLTNKRWKIFGDVVGTVYESYLAWGGKNFTASYGCIDAAMVDELGADRLKFIKASAITIEYSRNGGSTWTDYGATNNDKMKLFSTGGASFLIGKADASNKATTNGSNYQLRVTIDTGVAGLYTVLNKFVIYVSTNGSAECTVTIQKALQNAPTTYSDVVTNIPIAGWSGYNVINTSGITTYGNTASSQYGRLRFIFKANGGSSSYNGLIISKIMGFGGVGWSTPSWMAKINHLYSYDENQNAIFPANILPNNNNEAYLGSSSKVWAGIYATTFNGNLSGNVTGNVTGNVSGSSGSCTGNAGTATTLQNARTLWGQSFNGGANVTGNMTNVGPQMKLPAEQSNFAFLTSTGGAANGQFGKIGLNSSYSSIDFTNYILDVNGGKTKLNNTTAATTTNLSSQLIVANTSGGMVALELWRNSNASWQIANDGGILYIRNNWTTAKQNTYSQNGLIMDFNTGNTAIAGTLSVGQTTRNTSYKLYVNGTGYFNGVVTATSFTGNATSADSAKWLMNRGGSTVTISDGPWAHGQTGAGGTNAATVWHQRWKQSGLTYTPSGGSATTLTDSGDMVLWLAQSATSNALTVNMAIDGIIYSMSGFKGNLNGQASTVARATFGDANNSEHNANNIKSNGMWYYTSNGPATTLGATVADGALYSQAHSTNWAAQIAQDYRDGSLFIRGLKSGTWQNWYAIPKFTTTTGGLGSTTQPVYIDTNGELQIISYTIEKSVPSNAVFTDHYAWSDITGKPTKITLTGAVTGNVSLGAGELSLATTVNHNHDSAYIKKITSVADRLVKFTDTGSTIASTGIVVDSSNNVTIPGTALKITNTSGSKYILMGNQDSSGANKPVVLQAANGTLYIGNGTDWSSNSGGTINTALFMSADRKIGIGNTSPSTALDVNGTIKADKAQFGRYYYNVTSYKTIGTPKEILIKTKIPYNNGSYMPKIWLHMYNYGISLPTEITLVFYVYNGEFCNANATSNTSHRPLITLCTYTENNIEYVAIALGLIGTAEYPNGYFNRFTVDFMDLWAYENRDYSDGWTVTSTTDTTSIIPTTHRLTLSYIDVARAAQYLTPTHGDSFTTDEHGNFKHKRSTTSDYWHLDNNAGTAKFSVYWETGNVTAAGTITATGFSGPLTGNADTATKLAASKTIWGQSFDGSANVSGNLIGAGPAVKLPTNESTFSFFTSTNGGAYGRFAKLGLYSSYSNGDLSTYSLDVGGATRLAGQTKINYSTAASSTVGSGQLILQSGTGTNAVGMEFYRNSNTSWQLLAGGNFELYTNFSGSDGSGQTTYKYKALSINHTTLDATFAGSVTATNFYGGKNLYLASYVSNENENGIYFRSGFYTSNKYNLSILTYDHGSNGASPDGLSINANDGISFCTGSNTRNERMRIATDGKIGIGIISPVTTVDINGQVRAVLSPSSWLDGQRYNNAAYNIADYSNGGSYNPWMRATNTWASGTEDAKVGYWFSFGTLGTRFYWGGSPTTQTSNGFAHQMNYNIANGTLTAETFAGAFSGTLSGNATTSSYPYGFTSKPASATWGNTIGTFVTSWDANGSCIAFFKDNPASGQLSMKIDGTVYIKEGAQDIAEAVKSFSVSGQTVTYTTLWGNTGTFTTQDTNKYHKTGSWGGTNSLTYTATAVNSADALAFTLATASTSVYGATKLYDGVDSTSTTLAATANAVKTAYDRANAIVAAADAMVFKGTLSGAASTTYTPAADRGWTYKVAAAGLINGEKVEIGDILICTTDSTAAATSSNVSTIKANWVIVQNNVDGAVFKSSNTFTDGYLLAADGSNGKVKTINSLGGPFRIYTSANAANAFKISRGNGDAESVSHWVDDTAYHIDYTNDEYTSAVKLRLINTDTEGSDGSRATDYTYTFDYQGNFSGNAATATTATNLANNPSIQASTSNANQVTITAGGKTSGAYTIPYATSAGSATSATTATSANALNFVNTNELLLGNANSQAGIHINHRRVAGGASSGNTAITDYYFKNGNGAVTGVTIHAGAFNGDGTNITLGTASVAVVTDANKKLSTQNLSVTDANASTAATTTFVQSVTQSATGKITVTKASLNTSGTWSGNATTATRAKYFTGTINGGVTIDANNPQDTLLGDYGSSNSTKSNLPSGWTYGSLLTLGANGSYGSLSSQFAWDVQHNTNKAGRLWFRTNGTISSSSSGWKPWNEIAFTDSSITGNAANVTGTVAIDHGGTGKTTAAEAWTALGGGDSGKHADSYFALASHGTHVTTATVQSALSINTSSGSTSKALTEKGTFVTFGTSNLTIGTTSSTAMAGNTVVNKVNQTLKSDNTEYKFLGTASTATGNAEAIFDTDLTFNPSTNAITASIYRVTSAANISYNSTNGCLEIVV